MKKPVALALAALLAMVCAGANARAQRPPQKATKSSAKAPQQQKDPLAPLLKQAEDAIEKKDYNAAIPPLQNYLAQRPDDPAAHFQLGYAYSLLDRRDDAKAEYERAIALDSTMAPAHLNLGLVLLERDPAAAVEPFRRAAELQPEQARPRFLTGLALERSGKLAEALGQYESAMKLDEKTFDVRFALGRVLLTLNRAADAEERFREALALRKDSAPAHLGLANSLLSQKKLEAAAAEFAAYLELQPQDRDARVERAGVLADLERDDEALAELDRAESGAPATLAALKLRAQILTIQKKPDQAATALQRAAQLDPRDAEVRARLGRALLEMKNYAAAERELRAALAIDANWIDAARDLVAVSYLTQHYGPTLDALDRLATLESPNAGMWFLRAACYDKLGREAEAVAAYEHFLALDQGKNENDTFIAHERIRFLKLRLQKKKK